MNNVVYISLQKQFILIWWCARRQEVLPHIHQAAHFFYYYYKDIQTNGAYTSTIKLSVTAQKAKVGSLKETYRNNSSPDEFTNGLK